MRLSELPTPAMCVDLDVLERNIARMHDFFRDLPCDVRPHVKAHKTPAIAELQRAAGIVGLCTATVGEAEIFADHGFDDILVANEVCDPVKIARLGPLAQRTTLTVAVDTVRGCELLRGSGVRVLVDVNVGLPRCGVKPEGAAGIAKAAEAAGLEVVGVMGYEGHATVIHDADERAKTARASMTILTGVADELRAAGFDIRIVSGGSTLTYDVTGTFPGVTEVQVGSYAMMDTEFAKHSDFEQALLCLTTVISTQGRLAVLDAGLKTMTVDHGDPSLYGDVPADVLFLSDEHTTLAVREGWTNEPGDRVWLMPSHVDPTVNIHDRLYAFRGDEVEHVWPVAARGYQV